MVVQQSSWRPSLTSLPSNDSSSKGTRVSAREGGFPGRLLHGAFSFPARAASAGDVFPGVVDGSRPSFARYCKQIEMMGKVCRCFPLSGVTGRGADNKGGVSIHVRSPPACVSHIDFRNR